MTSDCLGSTERIIDADTVTASFAVEAAIHAVNVTASRGIFFTSIRHRYLGDALIFAAFLVLGAAQQA